MSLPSIHKELGIPKTTLSGWFKDIELTQEQKDALDASSKQNLVIARKAAAQMHRDMKEERMEQMRKQVQLDYAPLAEPLDTKSLEIALAMLYLGEGTKGDQELGLGNSDPTLLRFYVDALERLYGVDRTSLRADLHLRMDQDEDRLKEYWSSQINIPIERFGYVARDKRTEGKPTYPDYPGCCSVTGGGVEIQRRLLYLAKVLCTGQF